MRTDWLDLTLVPVLASASGRLGMTGIDGAMAVRRADGVDRLVLFVEDHELDYVGARDIGATLAREGVELVRHPVPDMDIPRDPVSYRHLLDDVRAAVQAGRTVVIACFGGFGRTGTAVACLLVDAGLTAEEAIALTRATRRGTIERDVQLEYVRRWGSIRR